MQRKIAALKRKAEESDMTSFLESAIPLEISPASSSQTFVSSFWQLLTLFKPVNWYTFQLLSLFTGNAFWE
jgi:hypothetical protein